MNRSLINIPLFLHLVIMTGSRQADTNLNIYHSFQQFISPIHSYEYEQLKGGLSNNSQYKCTVNGKRYVARLLQESYDTRKNELLIHLDCAYKGISPHIYYYSDDYSVAIMDFIEQHTITLDQANEKKVIEAVAKNLRTIHQTPLEKYEALNRRNVSSDIINWYSICKQNNPNLPQAIEDAFNTLPILVQQISEQPFPLVLSHNDMHLGNMFFVDNNIMIIDWEMVGINDPFFDLAVYSIYSCLSKEKEDYLLECYLQQKPSARIITHYNNIKLLALLFNTFGWLAYLGTIPQDFSLDSAKEFKYYAAIFAQNCGDNDIQFLFECMFSFVGKFWKEYNSLENIEHY